MHPLANFWSCNLINKSITNWKPCKLIKYEGICKFIPKAITYSPNAFDTFDVSTFVPLCLLNFLKNRKLIYRKRNNTLHTCINLPLLLMRFLMFLKSKKTNLDTFSCTMCYSNFKNKLKVIVIYMYSLLTYSINLH